MRRLKKRMNGGLVQKEVIMLEGTIVLDLNGDAASKFLRAPMGSLGKAHDRGQSCLPL